MNSFSEKLLVRARSRIDTCLRDEIPHKMENGFPRFTFTFSVVPRVNQLAVSYLDPQRNTLGDDRRDSHSANFVNQQCVVIIFFWVILYNNESLQIITIDDLCQEYRAY